MRIINHEGEYWTEGKGTYTDSDGRKTDHLNFWSKFEPAPHDKRDFFIVKALLLFLIMNLFGNRVTLEVVKGDKRE